MSEARFIIGDTREVTASLPDGSVDLILTSPPFLALRSYLPADHPDKGLEIGSEPTPAEFLDTLLDLVVEWRRVLAPHGSICVELGDTYSGSGGAGGDYAADGMRAGQEKFTGSQARSGWHRLGKRGEQDDQPPNYRKDGTVSASESPKGGNGWPLAKSLCGIPHLFHLSLAYGRNLLTGREIEPWRVRNVVAWCRPNPPVGALGDKFRPATSYMTVATVAKDRYFDLDAVRYPSDYDRPNLAGQGSRGPGHEVTGQKRNHSDHTVNPGGAPPLDWWEIPTQPYAGSHYATWPERLCERPIKAMVPEKVCLTCGEPSRRITEPTDEYANRPNAGRDFLGSEHDRGLGKSAPAPFRSGDDPSRVGRQVNTTGWTDCGHDNNYRRGIVLDPFAGSGTTLAVATGHGRDAIGIDLDSRNADLARERVGMWLTVEHFTREEVA